MLKAEDSLIGSDGRMVLLTADIEDALKQLVRLKTDLDAAIDVLSKAMQAGKLLRIQSTNKEMVPDNGESKGQEVGQQHRYLVSKLIVLQDYKIGQDLPDRENQDNELQKDEETDVLEQKHLTAGIYAPVNEQPSEKVSDCNELDTGSSLLSSAPIARPSQIVQLEDLLVNLFFTLWVEIPSRGEFTKESLAALKTYISILAKHHPGPVNVRMFLNEVNVWIAGKGPTISAAMWLEKLNAIREKYQIGFSDEDKRKAIEKAWTVAASKGDDVKSETMANTKEDDRENEREAFVPKSSVPTGFWYKVKVTGGFVVGAGFGSMSGVFLLKPLLRLIGFGQMGVIQGTIAYYIQQFVTGYIPFMSPVLAALQSVGSHGLTNLGKIGVGLSAGSIGGLIGIIVMI